MAVDAYQREIKYLRLSVTDRCNYRCTYCVPPGGVNWLSEAEVLSDDEILRQHFSLTQRESEVLLWIAKGKSNRDIGEILGLSARTVTKHLEQIYVKLGVENRASAAVKATHVLHGA